MLSFKIEMEYNKQYSIETENKGLNLRSGSMICSMTGYGRGISENEECSLVVEMKSINNRYLDIFVRMPRAMISLEEPLKNIIKKEIGRGKLDVFVTLTFKEGLQKSLTLNSKLLDEYRNIHRTVSERYEISSQVRAVDLMKFPDVISVTDTEFIEESMTELLTNATEQAVAGLVEMRRLEGENLKRDIVQRCEILRGHIDYMEENIDSLEEEYREKLQDKLTAILEKMGHRADEQRIVQEAAIMADKSCITEEVVRFKSHIQQLIQSLDMEEPVGRKLDFIIQEMNREVNTMGSKSDRLDIVDKVVILKSELEKIREQIQNIE